MQNNASRIWFALEQQERQLDLGDGWRPAYDSLGREKNAAQGFGMRDIAGQMSRVERVRLAIADSGQLAKHLIASRLTGISLDTIWHILVASCEEFALYYGGSVVAGAAIGAVGGAFLGGAGALPGAAVGATAGAQVGGWILGALGLKSLVEGLATAIPEALHYYERGFREAWGPTPRERQAGIRVFGGAGEGNVRQAAFEFANGHVVVIIAMLTAMMAYVSRGKGNKAALLQEIRESPRLGPKVAQWLEENQQRLASHPALQSRRHGASDRVVSDSHPPPKGSQGKRENAPHTSARMPQKVVPCFRPNDLPQASYPEFDRQLAGQEAGLNELTVEEYLNGRDAFNAGSVKRDSNIARAARNDYKKDLIANLREQLEKDGISPREAKQRAQEAANKKMSTLAALHNPDMVAAGPDVIADFGDRNVNSRIGAQWPSRVPELDDAATKVPLTQRAHAKMNAKLQRCK